MLLQLASTPHCIAADGQAVALAPRDAVLLAWLVLEGPTPRLRLAQLLWPESPPETARNALRQRLFQLRRQVGSDLVSGQSTLALAEGVDHDLDDADSVLDALGNDFGGEVGAWLVRQRARRQARLQRAFVDLAEMAEHARDFDDALVHAGELLGLDPLSEDAHRRVMRLHYLRGDRAAALLAFDACERVLKDEVGARPSAETLALLATLEAAGGPPVPPRDGPVSVLRPPRLIGRDTEIARLHDTWHAGGVLHVVGNGGMGKSRLLGDFVAGLAPGTHALVAARPGDAALPFALLGRVLRALLRPPAPTPPPGVAAELARLLPEFGEAPPLDPGAVRTRFVHAVESTFALARGQGVRGLFVDDLHWADEASAELLLQLSGDAVGVWVFAYREAELAPGVSAGIARLDASGRVAALPLRPLTPAQVGGLLESLDLPGFGGADQAAWLHQRTGGNPMFVLETVKAMLSGTELAQAADSHVPAPLPAVSRIIQRRIALLSPPAVRLARCAAVAGQDFSAALAARVLQTAALDLADGWNELEAAQVLRDGAFAHDLIYEAALASVPAPIARELHLLIAQDLEAHGADPGRIAAHWLEGGAASSAVPHLRRAAQVAYERFQFETAAQTFDRAAQILFDAGDGDGAFDALVAAADAIGELGDPQRQAALVERLETHARTPGQKAQAAVVRMSMEFTRGAFDDAMRVASESLPMAREAGLTDVESELSYGVGVVHWERREVAAAIVNVEHALRLRRALTPAQRGASHVPTLITMVQALGAMLAAAGRYAESATLVGEAYQLAAEARQPHNMLGAASELCLRCVSRGELAQALEWAERGDRAAAEGEVDASVALRFQMQRGLALVVAGRWGEALALFEALTAVPAHAGLRHWADLVVRRARLYLMLGRRDLALQALHAEQVRDKASAPQQLAIELALLDAGERSDTDALVERIAALEDIGLRARALVQIAPHGDPGRLLPVLGISALGLRDGGQYGQWMAVRVRMIGGLAATGRADAAAEAALEVWRTLASGSTPALPFIEVAAELCPVLQGPEPALAGTIAAQARGWFDSAVATLSPPWDRSCRTRHPQIETIDRVLRLG